LEYKQEKLMNIFITGGAGYIGSATAEALVTGFINRHFGVLVSY